MFYGNPSNLLLPGLAGTMGEGWETARRRDDANDWVRVRLGVPGVAWLAVLDTSHFKGNAPGWASLTGFTAGGDAVMLLPRTRLQPDTRHRFPLAEGPAAAEVRARRLGLGSMEERARRLGGELVITSAAGEGTTVRLEAPA